MQMSRSGIVSCWQEEGSPSRVSTENSPSYRHMLLAFVRAEGLSRNRYRARSIAGRSESGIRGLELLAALARLAASMSAMEAMITDRLRRQPSQQL
mgnify:CR=1 FL=1